MWDRSRRRRVQLWMRKQATGPFNLMFLDLCCWHVLGNLLYSRPSASCSLALVEAAKSMADHNQAASARACIRATAPLLRKWSCLFPCSPDTCNVPRILVIKTMTTPTAAVSGAKSPYGSVHCGCNTLLVLHGSCSVTFSIYLGKPPETMLCVGRNPQKSLCVGERPMVMNT